MSSPLVSVVVPAFNARNYVGQTIESIFLQDYRPLEVLVVDDGSTDDTGAVIEKSLSDPPGGITVRCLSKKNGGVSSARNEGIRNAGGEFIAFLDADDLWPEGKVREQVEIMLGHPEVALLSGDMQRFEETRITVASMFEKSGYDWEHFGDGFYVVDAYRKIMCRGNHIPTGTVMLRGSCLEETGLFDEAISHSEDADLWLRIAAGFQLAYRKRIWLFRRDHQTNLTGNAEAMYKGMIAVIRKHGNIHRQLMAEKGIGIRRCTGRKYFELACFLYSRGEGRKAARYFIKSFLYAPQPKTLMYFFTAMLSGTGLLRGK